MAELLAVALVTASLACVGWAFALARAERMARYADRVQARYDCLVCGRYGEVADARRD